MLITTSSHIFSLAEDHVYSLRKIGSAGDDSWLDSRRGEAFNRTFQVKLEKALITVFFEGKSIGSIALSNAHQTSKLINLVEHWNAEIGPTDLTTIKTIELIRDLNQLFTRKQFRIKSVTYNCAGLLGDQALRRDLWTKILGKEAEAADDDVIAIGFQETDNLNRSVKANASTLQRCTDLSKAYLYRSHTLISSIQLLGIMTLVFVRNPLVPHVSSVHTDTSSTGLLKMWGNKGAVLTRFNLFSDEIIGGGLEVSVVNCHLSAGEGVTQLSRRRWELREIGKQFGISNLAPPTSDGENMKSILEGNFSNDSDETDSISSISDEEDGQQHHSTVPVAKHERSDSLESEQWTLRPESSKSTDDLTLGQGSNLRLSYETSRDTKLSDDADAEADAATMASDAASPGVGAAAATIETDEESPRTKTSKYAVVMGDMNYRVLLSEKDVLKKIKKQEWDGLLAYDSLSIEKQQSSVFSGFEEPVIRFPPTFKYEIGTTKFKGRIPSYTDRIMYRTSCRTRVLGYNSIQDLRVSDHRPVALRNTIEVNNCISPTKHDDVISRSLRILDEAENNARPKLEVDQQQIQIEGPPLSTQDWLLTIRNEGIRPVSWVAENASVDTKDINTEPTPPGHTGELASPNPPASAPPTSSSRSLVSQVSSLSSAGSTLKTKVTSGRIPSLVGPNFEKASTNRLKAASVSKSLADIEDVIMTPGDGMIKSRSQMQVKITARVGIKPREFLILVKSQNNAQNHSKVSSSDNMEEISQKYVFVQIAATKSYLGTPLGEMPQKEGIPVAVRTCVNYLWTRGLDDMFIAPAEPALFQQVLKWLDNDEELDTTVLDAPDPATNNPVGVYAVSQALLSIFNFLPVSVMGPNLKIKGDATQRNREVVDYVCKLINHLQIDDDESLDTWAAVLYDHEDEKAGRMEKRAYLRSMLICN